MSISSLFEGDVNASSVLYAKMERFRGRYCTLFIIVVAMILVLMNVFKDNERFGINAAVLKLREHFGKDQPPCGSVCTYGGVSQPGKIYEYITKPVDCRNIMRRMAWKGHSIVNPPPKQPPSEMLMNFTQNGECPLGKPYYLNGVETSSLSVKGFFEKDIAKMIELDRAGKSISIYNGLSVSEMVQKYQNFVKGKRGFVVGTEKPWVEAILLRNGASHVTTIEFRLFPLQHPNLSITTPYKFAEMYLGGQQKMFDFGASYSSLEHSGLGRYGDPLNPYGDMEAMAQAFCITKPGGVYFLGVPHAQSCHIQWNAHRKYTNARLKHLTANWEVLDVMRDQIHYVIVLRKPQN